MSHSGVFGFVHLCLLHGRDGNQGTGHGVLGRVWLLQGHLEQTGRLHRILKVSNNLISLFHFFVHSWCIVSCTDYSQFSHFTVFTQKFIHSYFISSITFINYKRVKMQNKCQHGKACTKTITAVLTKTTKPISYQNWLYRDYPGPGILPNICKIGGN